MAMADDVILGKAETVNRCVKRIKEIYQGHEKDFLKNFDKQDAVVLNLQRACESSIDLAAHIVRIKHLGLPKISTDVFTLLADNKIISDALCKNMRAMVGFRNIAVHEYTKLDLNIVRNIIENHLSDFLNFIKVMLSL